jgi:cation-transporting ATPase 13A3/4/5
MSVVVKCAHPVAISSLSREGRRFALVKGAPEKVGELCLQSKNTQDDESDPDSADARQGVNLQRLLDANEKLSRQGCYVLMAAFKPLPDESRDTFTRNMVEEKGSLQPLGLLVFRNPLRPESRQVVADLAQGATDSVMVSGDSHLTAAAISREAGILSASKVLVTSVDSQRVKWLDMDNGSPGDPMADDVELVVSGEAWTAFGGDTPWLPKARVFGRTSPEQKVEIVDAFIRLGHTAMFVGDGGNDCGALRAAHVGVALAEQKLQEGSESGSIIAHFNTTVKTPRAAVQVVQEGRCALASSLATFRFLFGFGLQVTGLKGFMFGTRHMFHWTGSSLIMIEGLFLPCIIPCMVGSGPREILDRNTPSWSLLNIEGIVGMVGPRAIALGLICGPWFYLTNQDWFTSWDWQASGASPHGYISWGDNFEMEVVFLSFFSILAAQSFSFSLGGKFRAPIWSFCPLSKTMQLRFLNIGSVAVTKQP